MEIKPESITLIEDTRSEYISWYINDEEQFVIDILSAKKYEYLTSDEHAHKCKYNTYKFNSFLDAYMFLIIRYDLKPSELSMTMLDSKERVFHYDRSVADFALRSI